MKFEFKPSEESRSFKEYLQHSTNMSTVMDIYKRCMIIPMIAVIMVIIIPMFKGIYKDTLFYVILFSIGIVVGILVVLVMVFLFKISTKKVKNNKMYCDLESTFKFTIKDKYIIRENEFSTVKVLMKKVEKIKLLKYGVILCTEGERVDMFIPKDILPISINELIDLIKKENGSLFIDEAAKREKKRLIRYYMVALVIALLSLVASYFVGKYDYEHNFTRYDLIMHSDLVKQENHKLLYENESLGFKLLFPSKWEGKFGIEELDDRINVYYLVDGKQSRKTTLLFTIRVFDTVGDTTDFNVIKVDGNSNEIYTFLAPKVISTLEKRTYEAIEYNNLYRDIDNVKLQ